jgi:hypothetical protein
VLVASFGDPVAVDYAAFVSQCGRSDAVVIAHEQIRGVIEAPARSIPIGELSELTQDRAGDFGLVSSLLIFIGSALTARHRTEIDDLFELARRCETRFVGIISSFALHLEDPRIADVENAVVRRASGLAARVVVFRPGHVVSRHSRVGSVLRRLAPFYPLFPRRMTSCFLEGTEFFATIEKVRLAENSRDGPARSTPARSHPAIPNAGRSVGSQNRAYTLMGPNRPWRDMLLLHRTTAPRQLVATGISTLLSWLLVGHAIACLLTLLARVFPWLRQWDVRTLKPRSIRELLALCHRHNIDHVKVVGYNNGVNHFGHRHPGKTIVSTVRCRRTVHAGSRTLKADCGATVRNALDFLAKANQDLYVVPNYSYVCLGTAFFVPIHGSAVDYSTVADTVCRIVLYDPDRDQIIRAAREDTGFRDVVYNMQSRAVVLRLYLLAKPRSSYFVHRQTLERPSAADLITALRDPEATNVEIRQAQAASSQVTVARYYTELGKTSSPALELPRDALGRLWDRLEENPVTSFLMHALSRHVAWHTELFFTLAEFDLFWRTHDQLPLRKIQLRYLKRDGMPHSPFRDDDCVSGDLFLLRWNRSRFLEYLRTTLPAVRTNPGKHSH